MGLTNTAKKIQGLSERAEAMYKQVQELQRRIVNLEEEVDATHDTAERLDHQLAEQRALLLAIADKQGLDGEQILADAAIDDVEMEESEAATDESAADDDRGTSEEGVADEASAE